MKICVISNSHAASVKSGWEKIRNDFPNIDVTFFAAPNRGMTRVKFDSSSSSFFTNHSKIGEMLSMTSGGQDRIDLDDYDAFLVYGLFLDVPRLDVRLSEAVKTAAIDDSVMNSINFRFVRQLVAHTQAAVFFSASPMPTVGCSEDEVVAKAYHSYLEVSSWIESRYAHLRAGMIKQSVDTLRNDSLTKKTYSVGSTRLKIGADEVHSPADTKHMNDSYGAEYLTRALPIIRSGIKNAVES